MKARRFVASSVLAVSVLLSGNSWADQDEPFPGPGGHSMPFLGGYGYVIDAAAAGLEISQTLL